MRVNLDWLREWVNFDLVPEQLAEQLTVGGLEVASVEPIVPIAPEIVIAEVLDVQPHPNADRLTVCTVSTGTQQYSVVCGAQNVSKSLKTAFAPVGATTPNGTTIEAMELRGVVSDGMLCSAQEIGLDEDSSGLLELDSDAPVGTSLRNYMRLEDTTIDIDLTPNRGDCFSVIGIAREIAALNDTSPVMPDFDPVPAKIDATFDVKLAAKEACPRFVGRTICNVATGRISPLWMRERLRRAGLRPIHPVVDVTNYVMLELGQPLHSYDLSKLAQKITVRFGKPGEKLNLLDGTEIALESDILVIADGSGAIGMAGVMGGQGTAVEPSTQNVFLEAAFFSPEVIAGRARRFGFQTEASLRFERGVDPEHQVRAIERATKLLLDIAGGDPGPVVVAESKRHLSLKTSISLRYERLQSLLGVSLEKKEVEKRLSSLQMDVTQIKDGWSVVPPLFRFDISIEEDLIEEVGRMIGYDTIPAISEISDHRLGMATETRVTEERITDLFVDRGYSEVINYSFVDEELESAINPGIKPIRLANPISQELRVMRRSLWPGLLTTAKQNLSRQQERLRLFETGTQFSQDASGVLEASVLAGLALGSQWPAHWSNDDREVDFFDVKADLEAVFGLTGRSDKARFFPAEHPALTPGKCARILMGDDPIGWLGILHPKLQKQLELKKTAVLFALQLEQATFARIPVHKSYSKFPSVRRDIAVVLDENISSEQVIECVREAAGELLYEIKLFDLYRGGNIESSKKSIALGLILQGASRTLTDLDADHAMGSVFKQLERKLGATIRK